MHWVAAALVLAPLGALAQTPCPAGQVSNEDTRGNCCWPGQAWSTTRNVCLGPPQCPAGQVLNEDTRGNCCWPGQVWSVTRSVCVGTPLCPAGTTATATGCQAGGVVTPPPVAPGLVAPGAPLLSGDARILRHMQLTQELQDLTRTRDAQTWITSYIVAGGMGGGLALLGYGLNLLLLSVVGGSAGPIAAFWTFFGCALGGGITFAVMLVVGSVQLVRWIMLGSELEQKTETLLKFDQENGLQAPDPTPAPTSWLEPRPTLTVMRF